MLAVHGKEEVTKAPLVLSALESPAQAGHTEARLLSTALRFWFKEKGKDLISAASTLVSEHLKEFSPESLLRLRHEDRRRDTEPLLGGLASNQFAIMLETGLRRVARFQRLPSW